MYTKMRGFHRNYKPYAMQNMQALVSCSLRCYMKEPKRSYLYTGLEGHVCKPYAMLCK